MCAHKKLRYLPDVRIVVSVCVRSVFIIEISWHEAL